MVDENIHEVDARTLAGWLAAGTAQLVDVREPDEYAAEHVQGALNVPLSTFDVERLPRDDGRRIVLHCRSGGRSAEAAARLLRCGANGAWHLRGGLQAWRKAGLPTERVPGAPISVMRQVQITAGSLVVIGTALGAWVSPWWLLLSGFVGCGLVFAGVSGTCGLAVVLGRMPWNRPRAGCGASGGGTGQRASV